MSDSAYEVRVSGPIPEQMLLDLGVVARGVEGSQTVLYGDVRDESALFGLLARLRGLGLEVIEVRRTPHVTWLRRHERPDPRQDADQDQDQDQDQDEDDQDGSDGHAGGPAQSEDDAT